MINEATKTIYVDYSTKAVFQACKEKCRLNSVIGWRTNVADSKLTYGHAFHAAIAAYYDALAGGWFDENRKWHRFDKVADSVQSTTPTTHAKAAFLRDLKIEGATLPITLEAEDRRSIERGLAMVEAYIAKWRNEPYESILDKDGVPLTEVGFTYQLAQYEDYKIVHVGYIDRIMKNIMTHRPVNFETKTTTLGLDSFIEQSKPNDQVTGYYIPANKIVWELGFNKEIVETVWDCAFISKRKPDMNKALTDRHWMYGVDVEADFRRHITTRSRSDITEFLFDAEEWAIDYAKWLLSGQKRWPRSAPTACHMYGGCQFRKRCTLNFDSDEAENEYMRSFFIIKKWEPWKKILGLTENE